MTDLEPGTTVRDYAIVSKLGKGGMGQVYLVRHRLLGIERAMKLLSPALLKTDEARERFVREASLLAAMHHPNIVAFYEFGALDDGTQFLVMEHLRGQQLSNRIAARGPLSVAEACACFSGVARGLEEAHRHGIVHRDVSSDNILLASGPGGEVAKLIDFGIARPAEHANLVKLTQAGMFIGKCAYAAPEQLGLGGGGEPRVDHRTDLYALGVTLYEALVGRNPFAEKSLQGILKKKLQGPPPPPSEVVPDAGIPPALDRLVMTMLDADADARPQSMAAVLRTLEAVAANAQDDSQSTRGMTTDELGVNARVGEYTLEALIGQGGMGRVYRARHRLLGVSRALKLVNSRLVEDPTLRDRFMREAQILAQLKHPNLVRLHDFSPWGDDAYYMVQELVEGESLRERLERTGPLRPEDAIVVFSAVARGLGAAHSVGVVHRDVSPGNIMLEPDPGAAGTVKIIDFGIATAPMQSGGAAITQTSMFLGKLEYCSPEQAGRLEADETIDGRSDVYSLGAVLFHSLTGRLPFQADSPQGYLARHLMTPPPRPSSLGVNLPARLEQLILDMLAKDRAERPQTMEEVARRLESCLDDEPTVVAPLSGIARQPEAPTLAQALPAARHPGNTTRRSNLRAWALTALLAVSAAVAVLRWLPPEVASRTTPTVRPQPTALVEPTVAEVVADPNAAPIEPAPAPTVTASSPPGPDPELMTRVATLVAEGDALFERRQLTRPAGQAAVDRYRAALELDPNAPGASAGLEQIQGYFLEAGQRHLDSGDLTAARAQFEQAREILDDARAAAAANTLAAVQAERTRQAAITPRPTPQPTVPPTPQPTPASTPEAPIAVRPDTRADEPDPARLERLWLRVRERQSTEAIDRFLTSHPELPAPLRDQALRVRDQLLDDEAHRAAVRRGDRVALEGYLESHPAGRHRAAVQRAIQQRDQDAKDAFAVAERESIPSAYASFRERHPDAPSELLLRAQQRELSLAQDDDKAFRDARKDGTWAALREYIKTYPRGRHIDEVLEIMDAPKQAKVVLQLLELAKKRDPSLTLPAIDTARQAMDTLTRLGIAPCSGIWDPDRRLSPADLACIGATDPNAEDGRFAIDVERFAGRLRERLSR